MLLISCEINILLKWSAQCLISSITDTNQATIFSIYDTNLDVPVVTLSTKDNTKLLQ